MPSNFQFSPRALTRSRGWDAWLPLVGTPLCRFSDNGTPGHYTAWQAVTPGPFPRVTRAHALPTRPMAPRAPHTAGHPCPLPIPAPHGPLADKPGARGTHSAILTVRSHAPNRSTGLLHPSKRVRAYFPTNSKTTSICQFNYPLTHFKLDPGDPWAGITPPPNHSTHHALPIHSKHTQTRWAHSLIIHLVSHNSPTHTPLNTAIL